LVDHSNAGVCVSGLVEHLGHTLVEPLVDLAGLDRLVRGVVVHDPTDELTVDSGDLVLAVGVRSPDEVLALLPGLAVGDAAGLVVKWPAHRADDDLRAAVRESGIAVLGLTRKASWAHVVGLVRSIIAAGDEVRVRTGVDGDDLFALADAISAIVDGPVTIEDRSSQVLAFSGGQDAADDGRAETVLGRRVPQRWLEVLTDRGVFRELARGRDPVYVDSLPDGAASRLAVSVRVGDEVFGSVWAVVPRRPSPERRRAFREAADLVALHLLRLRIGRDVGRQLEADLIATALEGGTGAVESASRLHLGAGALRVLATRLVGASDAARDESKLAQLRDTLATHFGVLAPNSATGQLGDTVYTIIAVGSEDPGADRALALAEAVRARLAERFELVIAVGGEAPSLASLPRSRETADRVMRVLSGSGSRTARLSDVALDSMLLRLSDVLSEDDLGRGPVAALREYDSAHRTNMLETLRAYLAAMGKTPATAARLCIHPNTLRYRVRRLSQVGGLDLDDSDAVFTAALMLRLHDLRLHDPRER
jgi:hypothetical protein